MPVAHEISQPSLFLVGRNTDFSNYKVTTGYYKNGSRMATASMITATSSNQRYN